MELYIRRDREREDNGGSKVQTETDYEAEQVSRGLKMALGVCSSWEHQIF